MTSHAVQPPQETPGRVALAGRAWIHNDDLRFEFTRSSGPGGQNVNKVNTRAELRVPISAIHGLSDDAVDRLRQLARRRLLEGDILAINSQSARSQLDNKAACIAELARLVGVAQIRPKVRRKTKPSKAAKARRMAAKKTQGEKKARRQRPSLD